MILWSNFEESNKDRSTDTFERVINKISSKLNEIKNEYGILAFGAILQFH